MPTGKILRVKQGYNPNSSSIGSIIFSMSAAVIPATIIFGMVASSISTAILSRVGKRKSGVNRDPSPLAKKDAADEA